MKRPRAANRIAIIPPPVAIRAMCHHKRYTPPVLGASVVEISSVVVRMGSFVVTSSSTQVNLILQRDHRVSLVWVSQKHRSFIGNLQWRVGCQQRFWDQRFMCHSHRTFVELHVPPVNNFSSAIDNDKIVKIVRYLIKIFILKLVVENFTWKMKILEWCLSIWQIFSLTFVLTNFFKKITNFNFEHYIYKMWASDQSGDVTSHPVFASCRWMNAASARLKREKPDGLAARLNSTAWTKISRRKIPFGLLQKKFQRRKLLKLAAFTFCGGT